MGFVWSAPRPEVEVKSGRLRGKTDVTTAGTRYHAFMGVPYAKPPVGELRFKAPQPAEAWPGVRDAAVEGNPCYQAAMPFETPGGMSIKTVFGILKNLPVLAHRVMVNKKQSEDCLFLNVFSPVSPVTTLAGEAVGPGPDSPDGPPGSVANNTESPLRPVLFWIHGGAFKLGDGNPDVMTPDLLLDKNIVVVTINYRLGPFGFLSLGTADVPGNAGLKDQALALRWTHDNIRAFGGDPTAITLYGESAGGASAHYLNLSPLSRGLFRGVIAGSGSALSHWALTDNAVPCARALAKELGLEGDTPEELAKGLRAVSGPRLAAATAKLTPVFESFSDELMWLPVIESDHPGAFITEDPVAMVRDGKSSNVPVMTGVCSAEGLVWVLFADVHDDKTYSAINERKYYFLPPDLRKALTPVQRDRCVQDILDEYTGGKPFTKENVAEFIELYGDVMFLTRHLTLVQLHTAAAGCSPLYLYRFNFVGKFSCLKWATQTKLGKGMAKIAGAAHGDDLWYVASIRIFPLPTVSADSREMICRKRMVQLWANFVETGNPTPPGTDEKEMPPWTPCSASAQPYLNIEDSLSMSTSTLFPRQAFWEGLYQKYTASPMPTITTVS